MIREILRDPGLETRQKAGLVAFAARSVLAESAPAPEAPAPTHSEAALHARDAVRDILDLVLETSSLQSKRIANEVWALAAGDPELEHALDVATYSVLFAMSFGRIDETLIADIAVAALLHDIGLCLVAEPIVAMPQVNQLYAQRQAYGRHIDHGIALINAHAALIPPRVKAIILQHHEKFDGTGFPRGLQGFQVDDVAQLVIMADTLIAISSGRWDGTPRVFQDALQKLESLEKARTFPEYFNPDVFAVVLRWMREGNAGVATRNAAEVVRARAKLIAERHERERPRSGGHERLKPAS